MKFATLPAKVEILTHFGERAGNLPDNQRVAFIAMSFDDAFVIGLGVQRGGSNIDIRELRLDGAGRWLQPATGCWFIRAASKENLPHD